MSLETKKICETSFRSCGLLINRSVNENEVVVFRELSDRAGDVLDVYLNKGNKLLFSYDFPEGGGDPCNLTKEGKSWLKRSGYFEDSVSYGEGVKKVIDSYYDSLS